MPRNIQLLSQAFMTKMQSMGQSRPDPQAIGAAVQEFVAGCMQAVSQPGDKGKERRRARRVRD
ncbi:MAG: hypothetical protein GX354_08630 [Firmicutes bacterium]|jgi:hypothetical protein|nr:hypothetical protein [Bacillota bacterium]